MSEIINTNNEPIKQEKQKKIMSEKQKEALKKGRETAALKARERKQEKEKQKNNNLPEPLEILGEIQEKPKEPIEILGEIHEENNEDIEKPQPLLKQRIKKETIKEETKPEIKLTAKERLAEMRFNKKLELEEKKMQLEELKMNKLIEDENKKIENLKTIKVEQQHEQQHNTIFYRPSASNSLGRKNTRYF